MRHFLFLCLSVVAIGVASQSLANATPGSFTLENGLEVRVIPFGDIPAVSHAVWYKVGAKDEPMGKSGMAHLLEHMMFKGTKNLGPTEFSKKIADVGGNDNAFTAQDHTVYFQTIARKHLPLMMELEAERMQNLLLEKTSVETERLVVLEERKQRVDRNPRSRLYERMRKALYSPHPYSIPVIGHMGEVKAISKADMDDFYSAYYAPNNAVLVLTGDITLEDAKTLAKRYYGKVPSRQTQKTPITYTTPESIESRLSEQDETVQKPEWHRIYLAPSTHYGEKEDIFALSLLAHILGGSQTSILYRSLVIDKKLAVEAGADYDELRMGPNGFSLYAFPKDVDAIPELEREIEAVLEKVKKDGVSDEARMRAVTMMTAKLLYARDSFKSMGFIHGMVASAGLPASFVDYWLSEIKNVTNDDIKRAAKKLFKTKKAVTGVLSKSEADA